MHRARVLTVAPLMVGALIAGCGSRSSSSSSTAAKAPTSGSSSSSSGSRYPTSTSNATPASTAKPVMITTKHNKVGTILAIGPKNMTVYLFEGDKGSTSACSGACVAAWPPVIGKPQAGGAAMSADLGTITRPDGTTQVTYKGHPLYTFAKDKDNGDAYGQGLKAFGAAWYVLAPSGNKIDNT